MEGRSAGMEERVAGMEGRVANDGYDYGGWIAARDAGMAVLDYLTDRYPHSSRGEWLERLRAGRVLLQGRAVAPEERLRAGQELVWRRPPWVEPPVPLGFAVLHRDRHLLAVAKPAGLPTLPGGGYLSHTLLALVRRYDPAAAPLHRLDRGTSGIVLFARTPEARTRLSAAWAEGGVHKSYRALAQGSPGRDRFVIETPIGPWPGRSSGRPVLAAVADGRPARTAVQVLERRPGATLLEVTPLTGRAHQIRIHLAVAGHPLVGEPLYLPGGTPGGGRPGEGGFRLHARYLRFPHPETGATLTLECRPPADLRGGG